MFRPLCLVVALGLFICVLPVHAHTYLVRPNGLGDFPTIQAALNAVVDGDVIELADGRFTGNGNRDLDFLGKAVTVRSQSGDASLCVIDCQGSQATPHTGFYFRSGEGFQSVLSQVTVTNGWSSSQSGGVYVTNSSPTITGCIFTQNRGAQGGAIKCNQAGPIITDCEFRLNTAEFGGALTAWVASAPWVSNCRFITNEAWLDGGAIGGFYSSSPIFQDCYFERNHGLYRGGAAIFSDSTNSRLFDCTFRENFSRDGGAVLCCGYSHARFFNCSFYADSGLNGAEITCGCHGTAILERSILAFGRGSSAAHCYLDGSATLTCSDVYGNSGGDWVDCIADQAGQNGNFCLDPQFCDAAGGDLRLHVDSPCLPGHHPDQIDCGLIGAWPIGCPDTAVPDDASTERALVYARPNPFRHATRLELHTQSPPQDVRLEIFDAAGRRVRALACNRENSPDLALGWDGRADDGRVLPSGGYVCVVRLGGRMYTAPVIIVR